MNDTLTFLLIAGAACGASYYAGLRRSPGASLLPALPGSTDDTPDLTAVHTVVITCENLGHGAAGEPATDILTAGNYRNDITRLRRNGWGSSHLTVCRLHNPGAALALDVVHVHCGTPTCHERAEISLRRVRADLRILTSRGWRNTQHALEPLCPYCAGTRRRT